MLEVPKLWLSLDHSSILNTFVNQIYNSCTSFTDIYKRKTCKIRYYDYVRNTEPFKPIETFDLGSVRDSSLIKYIGLVVYRNFKSFDDIYQKVCIWTSFKYVKRNIAYERFF